jgi:acetyl esterase/lipase
MRVTVKPIIRAWLRAPHLPWPYEVVDHVGKALRVMPGTSREPVALPHCSADLVRPVHERPARVVVYLQGGAFLVGGQHLHRQLVSLIALRTNSTIIAPNYRKLPRHPIADAVADGLDAYRLALSLAARPEDVVIMGDSAGGFMTFMVAVAALREGLPMPAGLVAMSPLLEFEPMLPRSVAKRMTPGCALFPPNSIATLSRLAEHTHLRSAHRDSVLEAPSDVELAGLPQTLIQVSSSESLYLQSCRMATRLARQGVNCDLQIWDGQVHVFQAAHRVVPEAAQAVEQLVEFTARVAPALPVETPVRAVRTRRRRAAG